MELCQLTKINFSIFLICHKIVYACTNFITNLSQLKNSPEKFVTLTNKTTETINPTPDLKIRLRNHT